MNGLNLGSIPNKSGIGLRFEHLDQILAEIPKVHWFEALADNHMIPDSPAFKKLEVLRQHYPITLHSVGLSIGSTDALDDAYIEKLKYMKDRLRPGWVSEHLCWVSVHGVHLGELLPLPYTDEVVTHVSKRIKLVQENLEQELVIENVSSYLNFKQATMTEWEFLMSVVRKSGCKILLDINNIVVSSSNFGFSAKEYIDAIDCDAVVQYHLAGHERKNGYLFDSHGCMPQETVWQLYEYALAKIGERPTLIEWDQDIPKFEVLHDIAKRIDGVT